MRPKQAKLQHEKMKKKGYVKSDSKVAGGQAVENEAEAVGKPVGRGSVAKLPGEEDGEHRYQFASQSKLLMAKSTVNNSL